MGAAASEAGATMPELVLTSAPADGVVTVTLNRPDKRNALSMALRDAVSDALDALAAREDVKVVVLTGAGEVFSAGFDLAEFEQLEREPALGEAQRASSDRFHRTVLTFPLPLVAAVNGPALAGGFDLAVSERIRDQGPCSNTCVNVTLFSIAHQIQESRAWSTRATART